MKYRQVLIILNLLVIVAGCSLIYPPYHRPNVSVPDNWSFKSLSLKIENNLPCIAWWNKFHDPVLNELIHYGLRSNNTVGQARANIETAHGELLSVQLSFIPSLSLFAGVAQTPSLGSPGMFYGAFPGYFAFNVFNALARERSARIHLEAQQYMLKATNLILIGQIVSGYYTFIAQQEQLKLYVNYVKDIQELLKIQYENYKGGLSSLITVQETKQLLQEIKAQQHLTEDNIVKSQNALRYLINQNPGPILAGARFSQVKTFYPNFGSLPAAVLSDRPDVAYAETEFRFAVQNVGVVSTTLLPMVELDYFYGHAQYIPTHRSVSGPAKFADYYANWIIDPTIFGNIKAYQGKRKAAYYRYVDSVRKALNEVANDLSTHQKANERYTDIERAYKAAREKNGLNRDLYRQDIIAYSDLLATKLIVDETAIQLNNIKLLQMLSIINLYQDLGGGYMAVS